MKLISFLAVAAGGAAGAVLRYMISLLPFKSDFPFATLITNLLGAAVIGFIAGLTVSRSANKNLVLFFKTGVCGGFTTFSTFSLESYTLFENGKAALGTAYVIFSVIGCIIGVWLGAFLGKLVGGK